MNVRSRVETAAIGVTVFACGWILMGVEIVGGRMLSPYFGSGIWVWGSVISVFLVALSCGYYLGGLLSHKWGAAAGLAIVIACAAVSLLPVAFWYGPASLRIAEIGWHERWGSLFAAVLLFFIPSTLLGIVSPYAVRLTIQSLDTSGRSAGTLYSLSTLGSCMGCLFTSFYLILWMGIRSILLLKAGLLLVTAVWFLSMWYGAGRKR